MSEEKTSFGRTLLRQFGSFIGAVLFTLGLFLVLPVMQAIGDPLKDRDMMVTQDVGTFEPPPPIEIPDEPEEPEEEEPPPPELAESMEPLDLSQLELALNPGMGDGGAADFKVDLSNVLGGDDGGGMDEIFSLADLDQKPRLLFQRPPKYPQEMLRAKREGSVYVTFIVDQSGRVVNPKVRDSTDRRFEGAALEAVRQWKFEPGRRKGEKVQFKMGIPITFNAG